MWVQYAKGKPDLNKKQHLEHNPTPEEVARVLPSVGDEAAAILDA